MVKPIAGLHSRHRECSSEALNIPFALFSRSLLHPFTLGQNFESLTISDDSLGNRQAIVKRIPGSHSTH